MGKEQVDEKHEIKFFEIIYKLIEHLSVRFVYVDR